MAVVLEIAEDMNDVVELEELEGNGLLSSLKELMSLISMSENSKSKVLVSL